jgi:hypothetical protein
MLMLLLLSAFAEASILIVSFYWAPWITLAYSSYSSSAVGAQDSPLMLSEPSLQESENLSPSTNIEVSADPPTPISTASSLPFLFLYSSLMMCTMIGKTHLVESSLNLSQATIFTPSPLPTTPMTQSFKSFSGSLQQLSSSLPLPPPPLRS